MIKGRVWKFGDDIPSDAMCPGTSENLTDPLARAQYCLAALNPSFPKDVKPGDIIIAGNNFGFGSARESAPRNVRTLEVACIVARSFGRIFLRNCINLGLPLLECDEAWAAVEDGDIVEVDLSKGMIVNLTNGRRLQANPFPPFMMSIVEQGGLRGYALAKLRARREDQT